MSLIICDIDCTLYSYREFLERNYTHPRDTWNALVGNPEPGDYFPGIERTWKYFEDHIQERISGLHEMAGAGSSVMFFSAFPAENYKRKTFSALQLEMISSYPEKKNLYLKKASPENVILAIGDRPVDRMIAKDFNAKLLFIPFFQSLQRKSGKNYTNSFLDEVRRALTC